MFITTGDVFFALLSGGAAVAFTGVGFAVARARPLRVAGAILFAAGLVTIISSAAGALSVITPYL